MTTSVPTTNALNSVGASVVLVLLTLCLESAGIAVLLIWARNVVRGEIQKLTLFRSAVLFVRFTSAIVILHGLQILIWATYYRWRCFPAWDTAWYFSSATYSTVGYGDVVLPSHWRALGPLESIVGVLMCGVSVTVLLTVMTQIVDPRMKRSEK